MRTLLIILTALITAGCGSSGGSGSSDGPFMICSEDELDTMRDNLNASYLLTCDISLSGVWEPVGTPSAPFRGRLDGGGHTLSNVTVISSEDYVGLFGFIDGGSVESLNVKGTFTGSNYVGGIGGRIVNGSIISSTAEGDFNGKNYVGAVTGYAQSTTLSLCTGKGTVTASGGLGGGLTGRLRNGSSIRDSYATADIYGQNDIGGIAGGVSDSSIINTYSTGIVQSLNTTGTNAGGIAGSADNALIRNNAALNSKVGAIHAVGRVVGAFMSSEISDNIVSTQMAVWGQSSEDPYTPVNYTDMMLKETYEALGWSFGDSAEAPWSMNGGYPELYFIK